MLGRTSIVDMAQPGTLPTGSGGTVKRIPLYMPVLKTAPPVAKSPAPAPPLAPKPGGGVTPAFIPFDFEPMVMCAPGWTGPRCKTRISTLSPLSPLAPPTPATPGALPPEERFGPGANGVLPLPKRPTRAAGGALTNGGPIAALDRGDAAGGAEKGFMIAPVAIAVAATVGLIFLLRDKGSGGRDW